MGKRTPLCTLALVLATLLLSAMLGPVRSATDTGAIFSQIGAALASGNGGQALTLSNAALNQPGLGEADRSRLMLDRGLADQLQGDQGAALADLTEAINASGLTAPEKARALLERGLVLDGMNRLNDAIGDYGAVLRLTPNAPAALNNRANALRRLNRFEDAQRDYLASLAVGNPAPEYPYYGLGQIAESEGKNDQARSFYAKAVAANPDYALAAQRLTALGGTPPPPDIIALRPPKGVADESTAITLRPPRADKSAAAPQPVLKPAGYSEQGAQPGLRPALDNPGGQQVQLGAWRDEAQAAAGWDHAVKVADGVLSGFSPHIVVADLPGQGRYYRLRVVTADGKQLCAILTAKGLACIPARD